jgi:hypothetical protein
MIYNYTVIYSAYIRFGPTLFMSYQSFARFQVGRAVCTLIGQNAHVRQLYPKQVLSIEKKACPSHTSPTTRSVHFISYANILFQDSIVRV